MAYSADSFVADEQPTTAKWNKLWSNDASFNDGSGIADDAILARHVSSFDKSNLSNGDSNPYKFRAYHNTTQNTGNGAFAAMSFNTELFDTNSNFASSTYTVPVSGFYLFGGRYHISTGSPTRVIVSVYKNGSEISRGVDFSASGSAGTGVEVTALLQVSASDTIGLYSFGNTTLTITTSSTGADNNFWGILESRT